MDLATVDPDRPVADYDFPGVQGIPKAFADAATGELTFGDLAREQISGFWLVGGPERIADRLEAMAADGIDAFSLVYATSPGTFVDFIEVVAPVLQRRGLMQTESLWARCARSYSVIHR